jgi:hypothetical protein
MDRDTYGRMAKNEGARFAGPRIACLDMVRVDCDLVPGCPESQDAILLEASERGATVQTSIPIAAGSPVRMTAGHREVAAEVRSCEADQGFGYLLDLGIHSPEAWFPGSYTPAWQSSEAAALRTAEFVC